ncbi:MAG: transposase [Bacteroidota bacterium]
MSEKYKIRDQDKLYFVTFTVVEWVDVFTRNEYKDIIISSLQYCQEEKGLEIYAWCLMTNHLHLIIGKNSNNRLEEIVRDFKKFTSVKLCRAIESNSKESRKEWMLRIFKESGARSSKHIKYKFWKNDYHPIELFSNEIMDQKLEYIHNNPVEAGFVDESEAYLYSSARDYSGGRGLLKLEYIE